MRWLAAICFLLLAAPASAAAKPPDKATLKREGVRLRWPATTTMAAGDVIEVPVKSKRRRVTLSLTTNGRVVARRTLRNGTFRATLGGPGTYALRLVVGKRRYRSQITVPAPPAPPPPAPCWKATGTSATLGLSTSTARAGDTLTIAITNTSDGCLFTGVGYQIEQLQPDGSWTLANPGQIFITLAVIVRPGETYTKPATVPAGLPPGRYRVSDAAFGAHNIPLIAPFEIVP
jgi:hypothetical protein